MPLLLMTRFWNPRQDRLVNLGGKWLGANFRDVQVPNLRKTSNLPLQPRNLLVWRYLEIRISVFSL